MDEVEKTRRSIEMQVAAQYFDHRMGASVIEYALQNARALWSRTHDDVVRILWCPKTRQDDEFQGGQHSVFAVPEVHHTDDLNPERASCVLLFGPDEKGSDDNAVGIEFKLNTLLGKPAKGQTVLDYIKEACRLKNDYKVIEKIMTPSLLERLGAVPILPSEDPVEFVTSR